MKLVVGIFGVGTVGGGVVELLKNDSRFSFRKALVANPSKLRPNMPESLEFVTTAAEILDDSEINCIVEVMGGTTLAWEVVRIAIEKGKHVVTANKALISLYMDELIELLEAHPSVQFLYEGAVCGGIPIINTMKRSLAPDAITRVIGIMNGTTNYMLTEMNSKGLAYSTVLKTAQELGYAEAIPSADVEGWDARSKLCILTKLAFGVTVDETTVPCQGIAQIQSVDFEYGRMMGHTIKLLGIAETVSSEKGETKIAVCVCPVMVPLSSPLAHVDGATNAVELTSKNLGSSLYVGPGAGRFPTANSVVADLMELASSEQSSIKQQKNAFPCKSSHSIVEDLTAAFYIRMNVVDTVGVIFKISEVLMKHNIPIFSILQTPIKDKSNVPFVIITESCSLLSIESMRKEVEERRSSDLHFVLEAPLCLRYFSD